MTVAPETDPTYECVDYLKSRHISLSLGHSNATFEEAQNAFDKGIRLMTHTFNALPPLHHRAPGAVVAAMLDDRVSCCVICDGLHVDPQAVKLLLKVKGVAKVILVTDAAQVGTKEGGLVGSSIDLSTAVRNVTRWGAASFPEAVRMATVNPAKAMGMEKRIGQIDPGHCADLVVWDKHSLAIRYVIVAGRVAFRA